MIKIPINLTPVERMRLKIVKYTLYVIFLNVALAILSLLATGGKINISVLLTVAGGQAVLAALLALDKYFSAQGDLPLVVALDTATKQVETELHTTAASVTVPDLPKDLLPAEPTQQITKPLPVQAGIIMSVGGEDTLPKLPAIQATTPQ